MAETRLLFGSLKTGELFGELKFDRIVHTDVLNGPGSIEATLPLRQESPGKTAVVTDENLAEARTALWVDRDRVPRWGGIFWTPRAEVASNQLTLIGKGWHSYFRRRRIRETKTWASTDQYAIARGLIDYAQGVPGGDIGVLTTDTNTSSVSRDRTYPVNERKSVGEALEQLAAVRNGFTFRYDTHLDTNGDHAVALRLSAGTGRQTAHVFELGKNVELLNLNGNTDQLAFQVDAVGAGEGTGQLIRTAQNPAALGSYPLLDAVTTHIDVRIASTLDDHAAYRLQRGAEPIRSLTLSVLPDKVPVVGSYIVGDIVKVVGSYGWLDVNGQYRIVSIRTTIAGGTETVVVNVAPWELFT